MQYFYRSLPFSSSLSPPPHISQPRLLSPLQECAEPSECCVWFPWHFHAACDSAKTQHALTSQAPAPALVLLKHTTCTREDTPAREISPSPGISWGVDVVPWPLDPPLLDSSSSRVFKQFQETDSLECELVMIFEDFLYLLCSFVFFGSLFGWSLSVVISSPSGLFSFSLSKIPSPLVFALTGWKCQRARLGKGRSTGAPSNFKHFIDPRLLRRDGRPRQGRFQQRRLNPRAERPIPWPFPALFSSP